MKDYLVFRLYGPMASWGLPAVGGDRPTGLFPGRAALSGLLGAALGIRRDESARLDALHTSISLAVKQVTPTSLLRDYQTAQVPSKKKGLSHLSRKSELSEPKLNTILSSRDYRCDGAVAASFCSQRISTIVRYFSRPYSLKISRNAIAYAAVSLIQIKIFCCSLLPQRSCYAVQGPQ